jgi:hypothetical protein
VADGRWGGRADRDVLKHKVTAPWQEALQLCEDADAVTHDQVALVCDAALQPRRRAVLAGRSREQDEVR